MSEDTTVESDAPETNNKIRSTLSSLYSIEDTSEKDYKPEIFLGVRRRSPKKRKNRIRRKVASKPRISKPIKKHKAHTPLARQTKRVSMMPLLKDSVTRAALENGWQTRFAAHDSIQTFLPDICTVNSERLKRKSDKKKKRRLRKKSSPHRKTLGTTLPNTSPSAYQHVTILPSPGFRASQSLIEGEEEEDGGEEPQIETGTPRGDWLEENLFKGTELKLAEKAREEEKRRNEERERAKQEALKRRDMRRLQKAEDELMNAAEMANKFGLYHFNSLKARYVATLKVGVSQDTEAVKYTEKILERFQRDLEVIEEVKERKKLVKEIERALLEVATEVRSTGDVDKLLEAIKMAEENGLDTGNAVVMSANSVLREVRKEHAERLHRERLTAFRDELRTLKAEVEEVRALDFDPIRFEQWPNAKTGDAPETNESKPDTDTEAEAEAEADTNAGPETVEAFPETNSTGVDQAPEAEQLVTAAQKPKIDKEAAPPEQQEEAALKTAFDKVDADANGAINFQQMTLFIKDLGWNLTAQSAFDFLEKGENDTVTFEDFLRWKGFAWQHKVALVRRLSFRKLQSPLHQIAEDEDEEDHNIPDTVHEAEAAQDSEDENVAQLHSIVETLQNHLARLHEHYEELCEKNVLMISAKEQIHRYEAAVKERDAQWEEARVQEKMKNWPEDWKNQIGEVQFAGGPAIELSALDATDSSGDGAADAEQTGGVDLMEKVTGGIEADTDAKISAESETANEVEADTDAKVTEESETANEVEADTDAKISAESETANEVEADTDAKVSAESETVKEVEADTDAKVTEESSESKDIKQSQEHAEHGDGSDADSQDNDDGDDSSIDFGADSVGSNNSGIDGLSDDDTGGW